MHTSGLFKQVLTGEQARSRRLQYFYHAVTTRSAPSFTKSSCVCRALNTFLHLYISGFNKQVLREQALTRRLLVVPLDLLMISLSICNGLLFRNEKLAATTCTPYLLTVYLQRPTSAVRK